MIHIGDRVRALRLELGLAVNALSLQWGCERVQIARLERTGNTSVELLRVARRWLRTGGELVPEDTGPPRTRSKDDVAVGAECKRLRAELGWSVRDLAAAAGCSYTDVSVVERGLLTRGRRPYVALKRYFVAVGR